MTAIQMLKNIKTGPFPIQPKLTFASAGKRHDSDRNKNHEKEKAPETDWVSGAYW
ncbi:hypothetical protein [Thalassospira permensis]|jgi:hypothetical protein|uniref:hypothetical protein n=1 Tax=Thalassospira permensis TaxID=680197 RepID=UPI0012EC4265|nr:hypothetical protein [Thalassospira permensis]